MERNWEESLRRLGKIPEIKKKLRFDLPWISISLIARQYFCEVKVENMLKFGDVVTDEKIMGELSHERIFAREKIDIDTLIKIIREKPVCRVSFPVYMMINDVPIAGIPDEIIFVESKPVFLVELKTTGKQGNLRRVWRDEIVQAKVYSLALDYMGFDCESLKIVIAKILREDELPVVEKGLILEMLFHKLIDISKKNEKQIPRRIDVRKLGVGVHIYDYNREDALKDTKWALGYWLKEREPIPTSNPNKCRVCEYSNQCPHRIRN